MLIFGVLRRGSIQFHWSAEIYGFGNCFRSFIRYPWFLPIFLTSDHGINLSQYIDPEIKSGSFGSRVHLTWSEENTEIQIQGITIVPIQHPWLMYFENSSKVENNSRRGSIFYPLHKAPGYDFFGLDDQASIDYLNELPDEFHPIEVSLHMHDLGGDRQKLFEDSGFKTVSLGETNNPSFHRKFFSLVSNYKYAFSESWGSHVPFLIKSGIPTQIIPRAVTITRQGESAPVHSGQFEIELRKAEEMFETLPYFISSEQMLYIDKLLGVQFRKSRLEVSKIVYGELCGIGLKWILRFVMARFKLKVRQSRAKGLGI